MQYVYVLNKHGEPLMPCSPGKARLLLKQQKACVVKRTPFTIKRLMLSKGIVFGIRFSTRDKSASFPVVVHREVLPSKS